MNKIAILYDYYYDFNADHKTLGGIQTYITDLIDVCNSLNIHPIVYQMGRLEEQKKTAEANYIQLKVNFGDYQSFAKQVSKRESFDLVIYATDTIIPKHNPFKNSIAIQHGIFWDIPHPKRRNLFLMRCRKAVRDQMIYKRISRVKSLVCVDYNFINWLRAESDIVRTKLIAIPNYTRIPAVTTKPKDIINIIFARRLWWYRGTRVFIEAIIPILDSFQNIHITVAGEGPDLEYMHTKLSKYSNVHFITYESKESLSIHADKHIAIVPTVGSEGTSLSLLEAMASQCAVIASNVGGMTNIILNGYNGLMVNAGDSSDLTNAIRCLISDNKLREQLSENAYSTASLAFSYSRWKNQWITVLKNNL